MTYPVNSLSYKQIAVRIADLATFLSNPRGKVFYRHAYHAAWQSWQLEIGNDLDRDEYNERVRMLKDNARADALTDVTSKLGFEREELMEYSDCQDNLNTMMWANCTKPSTVARKMLYSGLIRLTEKEKNTVWELMQPHLSR